LNLRKGDAMMSKVLLIYWATQAPVMLMQALPSVQTIDLYQRVMWAQAIPPVLEAGQVQQAKGLLYFQAGQWDGAAAHYLHALRAFRAACDLTAQGYTLTRLSVVFAHRKQYRWAVEYAKQAVKQLSQVENPTAYAAALHNLGIALYHRGRNRAALRALESACGLRHEAGDDLGEAITLGCMGRVHMAMAEYWSALSCYEIALDIYQHHQSVFEGPWYEIMIRLRLAKACRRLGHPDEAIKHYQIALALSDTTDKLTTTEILTELGQVYEDLGQFGAALSYYQQAKHLRAGQGERCDRTPLESLLSSDPFSLYY
jgi:tetratricopeptide (TPR) repeat protein